MDKTDTNEARNLRITEEYINDGFATMESIGAKYGVTRERVRQIVRRYSNLTPEEMNRRREEHVAARHAETIARIVRENPEVASMKELAVLVGVPRTYLSENEDYFAEPLREIKRRRRQLLLDMPRSKERVFDNTDIINAVKRVANLLDGAPVNVSNYQRLSRADEPSLSLISTRMGSLIEACKAAGVPHSEPRSTRVSASPEKIAGMLVKCSKEIGLGSVAELTYGQYSQWAKCGNGISGSRVRQVFSDWNSARKTALKLV